MRGAFALLVLAAMVVRSDSQERASRVDGPYEGYPPVVPPPDGSLVDYNDTEVRRPFSSAKYTYHAGTFDLHRNDTVSSGESMVSTGVFAFADENVSAALEADFWSVVDGWEQLSTARWATPVLGVDHTRVFSTFAASRLEWPWRERLLDDELEELRELGFKKARLSFQWVEAEPNWEQMGLQYLYLEYLSELKRLNSGIAPRNITVDAVTNLTVDHGVNREYFMPMDFSAFVASQGYDPNRVMEAGAANSHSRPAGSIFPHINYTALAPELASNWVPEIGRGVYFHRLSPPVYNHSYIELARLNMTEGDGVTTNATVELSAQAVKEFAPPGTVASSLSDLFRFFVPRRFTFEQLSATVKTLLSIPDDTVMHLGSTNGTEFEDSDAMLLALGIPPAPAADDGGDDGASDGDDAAAAAAAAAAAVAAAASANVTVITPEVAAVCTCAGAMPPGETCREYVPRACLAAEMALAAAEKARAKGSSSDGSQQPP
jgi:hypothetical protein|eukprot:COSAG01_NODE_3359_length_6191_cov_21.406291_5_plen_490_part_00